MRALIECQFSCRVLTWDEPAGAGDGPLFAVITSHGEYVCADSISLLISALQDEGGDAYWRAAA